MKNNNVNLTYNSEHFIPQLWFSGCTLWINQSARWSRCKIDGSYEWLDAEESDIGWLRTENLQRKWPITAVLWFKTDIPVIYNAKGGPWRWAKAYTIRPAYSSPTFSEHLATFKYISQREICSTLLWWDNYSCAVIIASEHAASTSLYCLSTLQPF